MCVSACVQVRQSFATSLRNLGTDYIDSLVMHSPMRTHQQSMEGKDCPWLWPSLCCAGDCCAMQYDTSTQQHSSACEQQSGCGGEAETKVWGSEEQGSKTPNPHSFAKQQLGPNCVCRAYNANRDPAALMAPHSKFSKSFELLLRITSPVPRSTHLLLIPLVQQLGPWG